jgi:Flp pilus assembly protein protease CpaA
MLEGSPLLHAALAIMVILAGIQDWRTREVSNWLTWSLFFPGFMMVLWAAVHLNFLPLIISILLLISWYFGWMGGADVRVFVGLWGFWPMAGLLALFGTGCWGLILVLNKRGREKIPALVSTAFTVALFFIVEWFK